MSNYGKKLIVKPGSKIRLKHFDPGYHGKDESHKSALLEIQENLQKMDQLQYRMYAENKHSLLIVLQGLDAAGKDGVVRHVLTGMNPSGCISTNFKQPTNDQINEFEWLITTENNTTILKFFLHTSKEEQLARFKKRLDDPDRQWKISDSDYKEREYWGDYVEAFEDVLNKTSTEHAPWFIIPSNHKWFRDLAISQIIVRQMEEMDMQLPKPTVNLTEIRREYHQAAR